METPILQMSVAVSVDFHGIVVEPGWSDAFVFAPLEVLAGDQRRGQQ